MQGNEKYPEGRRQSLQMSHTEGHFSDLVCGWDVGYMKAKESDLLDHPHSPLLLFDFYWNFATIVSQAFTLSPFFTHTSVPNGKNKSILEPNFINPTCEHWSALSPAFA